MEQKKLVIGWFSFTCCEDSTIVLTELLNDHLDEWKKVIEFKHMRVLKTKNDMSNLDVAFIEGAASSEKQEEEMKKIRENAKYVVAIGACACTGPGATGGCSAGCATGWACWTGAGLSTARVLSHLGSCIAPTTRTATTRRPPSAM